MLRRWRAPARTREVRRLWLWEALPREEAEAEEEERTRAPGTAEARRERAGEGGAGRELLGMSPPKDAKEGVEGVVGVRAAGVVGVRAAGGGKDTRFAEGVEGRRAGTGAGAGVEAEVEAGVEVDVEAAVVVACPDVAAVGVVADGGDTGDASSNGRGVAGPGDSASRGVRRPLLCGRGRCCCSSLPAGPGSSSDWVRLRGARRLPGGAGFMANSCAPGMGGGRKLEDGDGKEAALGGVSMLRDK